MLSWLSRCAGCQVLIDPVCLLTIYPQLLRNFLYKVPTMLSFSSLLGVIDWMRYLFSRDLLIAEVKLLHLLKSKCIGPPRLEVPVDFCVIGLPVKCFPCWLSQLVEEPSLVSCLDSMCRHSNSGFLGRNTQGTGLEGPHMGSRCCHITAVTVCL